jgi:hypothetical protein
MVSIPDIPLAPAYSIEAGRHRRLRGHRSSGRDTVWLDYPVSAAVAGRVLPYVARSPWRAGTLTVMTVDARQPPTVVAGRIIRPVTFGRSLRPRLFGHKPAPGPGRKHRCTHQSFAAVASGLLVVKGRKRPVLAGPVGTRRRVHTRTPGRNNNRNRSRRTRERDRAPLRWCGVT